MYARNYKVTSLGRQRMPDPPRPVFTLFYVARTGRLRSLTPPATRGSLPDVFGSLGGSEVIVLFVLALLLFGPRRLPEIGKTIGKAVAEFRKASQDFRTSLEREVEIDKLKEATRSVEASVQEALPRGSLLSDAPSPDPSPRDDDGNRAGA